MTKTIRELQLLEAAIVEALSLDEIYDVKFLCKINNEVVSCNTLTYFDNTPCIPIPPDAFLGKPNKFEPFFPMDILHAIDPSLSGSSLTIFLANIVNSQDFLLSIFSELDLKSIANMKQLEQLPLTLRNVTFLKNNQTFPFILVDENEPITVLSLSATLK